MSSLDSTAVLVFVCLSSIYAAITVLCTLRLVKLHKFSSEWKHTKFFYWIVMLQGLIRTVFFLAIMLALNEANSVFFLLLSLPDSLFIIDYILLIWQMVLVFLYTHEQPYTMPGTSQFETFKRRLGYSVLITAIAWISIQLLLYTLYSFEIIGSTNISRELALVNFGLPTFCTSAMIYLQVKHSGVLPRSSSWQKKAKKMSCVTFFWSVTRIGRGVVNILEDFSVFAVGGEIETETDDLVNTSIWIFIILLSEVMCLFSVLDYGFISIFLFSEEDYQTNNTNPQPAPPVDEIILEESFMAENPYIEEKDIKIIEEGLPAKGKLGVLCKAEHNGKPMIYRRIVFSRLSRYVIEDFSEEIESYRLLTGHNFTPVKGITLNLPVVGILIPLYEKSLYQLLHEDKYVLPLKVIIDIATNIGISLAEIHGQKKAHGHITPYNIFIEDSFKPYIADLGFHKIKKYASVTFGYTYKSAWSSPEILQSPRLVPVRPSRTDDVFSFGMILWEMASGTEPFAGYSVKELTDKVREGLRPKMPQGLNPSFEALILSCWNVDPSTRPAMNLIVDSLQTLSMTLR